MRRLWPAGVLLILSLASGVAAFRMGLGSIAQPGPGLFPFACSGALFLVCLALILEVFLGGGSSTDGKKPSGGAHAHRVLAVAVGVSVFGLMIEWLGLAPGVFVILCFFWLFIERQHWLKGLIMSALSASFCYILFDALLGVHFPRGLLGF